MRRYFFYFAVCFILRAICVRTRERQSYGECRRRPLRICGLRFGGSHAATEGRVRPVHVWRDGGWQRRLGALASPVERHRLPARPQSMRRACVRHDDAAWRDLTYMQTRGSSGHLLRWPAPVDALLIGVWGCCACGSFAVRFARRDIRSIVWMSVSRDSCVLRGCVR